MKRAIIVATMLLIVSVGSAQASGLGESGKIVFGTAFEKTHNTLVVTHKQDSFRLSKPSSKILWVAYLKQNAAKGLKITVSELSPRQKNLHTDAVTSGHGYNEIENSVTVNQMKSLGGTVAGKYEFTYKLHGKTEASGTFKLVK